MEDEDLIVSHALLSNNDLLTPVDDEVAALVVLTVLASPDSIILTQAVQLAELRPQHDRDLPDHDPSGGVLGDDLFDFAFALAGLGVELVLVAVELLLGEGDVDEELGRVGQVPHARLVRVDRPVLVVLLGDARALVHARLPELDLPHYQLIRVLRRLV